MAGSRHHTGIQDIDPGRRQPGDGRRGEELPRRTGVPAHDRLRSMTLEGADLTQHVSSGH